MKLEILLLAFFMLAFAYAQEYDPNTGCTKYSDRFLCPQVVDVKGAILKYKTPVNCTFIGREEIGCYGIGELVSDINFEECKVFVPVIGGNVDYDGTKFNYNCQKKIWRKGTDVELITYKQFLNKCVKIEGSEYHQVDECRVVGDSVLVNASIAEMEGRRYMEIYSSESYKGFIFDQTLLIIIAAIIIILLIIFWGRKRKR